MEELGPAPEGHLAITEAELRRHLPEHNSQDEKYKYTLAAQYNRYEALDFLHQALHTAAEAPAAVVILDEEEPVMSCPTMYEALRWLKDQGGDLGGYRVGPLCGARLAEVVAKLR